MLTLEAPLMTLIAPSAAYLHPTSFMSLHELYQLRTHPKPQPRAPYFPVSHSLPSRTSSDPSLSEAASLALFSSLSAAQRDGCSPASLDLAFHPAGVVIDGLKPLQFSRLQLP